MVEAHRIDGMGVELVAQYLAHVAHQYQHTHRLEAARGGACHAATEREHHKEVGDGHPPVLGIGGKGAGGGEHTDGLHDAAPQRITPSKAHIET